MNKLILSLTASLLLACTSPKSIQNQGIAHSQVSNQPSPPLVETYWKLVELNGNAVAGGDRETREAHLILKNTESRIQGHSGCNRFFGTYTLGETNRITMGDIGSTKMACLDDSNIEYRFFDALGKADRYSISGDTLSLHRAKMAPLAKFVAVYLR